MIKYKAKRTYIFLTLILIAGAWFVGALALVFFKIAKPEIGIEAIVALFIGAIMQVSVAFACGHANINTYVFTSNDITIFRGKKQIQKISIADILSIRYETFTKDHAVNNLLGTPKNIYNTIYAFTNDGTYRLLQWTTKELAQKLRAELYGKLVVIE